MLIEFMNPLYNVHAISIDMLCGIIDTHSMQHCSMQHHSSKIIQLSCSFHVIGFGLLCEAMHNDIRSTSPTKLALSDSDSHTGYSEDLGEFGTKHIKVQTLPKEFKIKRIGNSPKV